MLNSFYGLEMGKRALNAFRLGLQTVGHNVSNMKTAGYSRQRVNLSTMPPATLGGPGQVGMGVKVNEIVRIRDEFLDFQYRSSLSTLGYWDKINKLYEAIQNYIPEPVKPGIRVSMDKFFNAMQKLQESPESTAARQTLVEAARSLGGTLSGVIKGFESYSKALNDEVKTSVDQANRILHEIASLNKQIYQLKALGQNPNDLLDQRDLLLDKISKMMDVTFQEPLKVGDTNGEFFMTLNGRTLIQGDHVRELRAHAFQWDGKVYYDVQVAENEFDIVENCKVADVLATGPEGVHQLNVDRLANGREWEIGGGDPLCLNPDGTVKEPHVSMRQRPMTTTEALGIKGSFRIQVGTQGTRVASKIFSNTNNPDLNPGDILGPGKPGDSYTFRVGAHDTHVDVTVKWDDTAKKWKMTSDVFATAGTSLTTPPATYPAEGTGDRLTVGDVAGFLKAALPKSGQNAFSVHSGPAGTPTQFAVESSENWLVSITDVEGDLAARMGMKNPSPTITIDVEEGDSLEVIRNKINEKYQAEFGVKAPEQWVHASLKQDSDQSWYLTFASDVPGEAQRITLLGGEDGNLQTLRRLGLLKLEQTGKTAAGAPVYREVSAFSTVAEDASFTFDGVRYLSADNKFDKARRVPALGNDSDYSARTLSTVSDGMRFKLKNVGSTAITVRHHVRGGSIKALEEARDGVIPGLKATLDGLAWELVKHINAYQYSGYGIGGNQETTGVAFFKPLRFKSDAASGLDVNEAVRSDNGLIGAAMGKLDTSGKATFGKSGGSGNGKNAARMLGLKSARVLENGSTTVGGYYDAFLAKVGSDGGHAELMFKAQQHIASQLDVQRQSVMGVNMDEELLDMMALNKAFGAMARYATTVDEMLDRIINGFGLVGR